MIDRRANAPVIFHIVTIMTAVRSASMAIALLAVTAVALSAKAAEDSPAGPEALATSKPVKPVMKLGTFAAACSTPQVTALLRRDPNFDINAYPATLTPVQLATTRFIKALEESDLAYQDACQDTIETIISDQRYSWREVGQRQTTDLFFLLGKGEQIGTTGPSADGYRTAVLLMLELLSRRSDFDINYRLKAPHGFNHPATAAGAVAVGGTPESWCFVRAAAPAIDLEARPDDRYYTPLLLAITAGRLDMVSILFGSGADWLANIDRIDGWAAKELALEGNHLDIRDFLIAHRQGRELGNKCPPRKAS